jgi:hypothetical protein
MIGLQRYFARWGRTSAHLLGAIVVGLLLTGLSGCGIQSPESPSWDTEITVPLINHHYDMLELVDRIAEDALTYDSNGLISLTINQEIDTIAVDAGLSIADLSTGFSETLGMIELQSPEPVSEQILLEDHIPLILGDVPATGISSIKQLPQIAEIETAAIESGVLIITVENNFGLPLDSVTIAIIDNETSTQIGVTSFAGGIADGATKSKTIDLSGKTISNSLSFDAYLHTPGGTLFILSDNSVSITAEFSNTITVSSATARIPSQVKSYDQSVSFTDDNVITLAEVGDGQIEIQVDNVTNLSAELDVSIDQFTLGGVPLSFTVNLLPQQSEIVTRDLSGYTFAPVEGEDHPTVNVEMNVSLPGSGLNAVQVSASDNFAVDIAVDNVTFRSVSGVIQPTEVEIDPITESVEIPNGFENFSLTSAVLTMTLHSAVNLPNEIEIHLEGDAGQTLDISRALTPGTVENPGITTIVIDDLSDFLNPIPSEITVSGRATVGNGVTHGSVTENDFVWATVEIASPLEITVGETEFESDINEADLDDIDDEDTDRLNSGTAYIHLTNHLPLGATLTVYLGGDSLTLFDDPEVILGPVEVRSGTVGGSGLVIDSIGSVATLSLTREELQVLKNNTLYVGQVIAFSGTDGQTVRIVSSDYIDIQACISVNVRLGDF